MKFLNRFLDSLVSNGMSYGGYLFFRLLCRGKIEGEDILKGRMDTNFILVSNHESYLDWLVLWGIFKYKYGSDILFLAKDKLFVHPFWGRLMRYGNCIRVNDEGSKIIDERSVPSILKNNKVAIFPEGTRSRTGELQEFKPGAVVFSMRNRVDLIPVGLVGFYECWRPEQRFPRPGPCRIRVGNVIPHGQIQEMGREATGYLKTVIAQLSKDQL